MIITFRKRFDDYKKMCEVFRDFKNELLGNTLVEKLWLFITLIYQELSAEMSFDLEMFLDKLAGNEINIKKLVQIQIQFLK